MTGAGRERWELWAAAGGGDLTFFPAANESARRLLPPDAALAWTVEAGSYNEAMTRYYEHMGWAPYKPMD